MHFTYPCFHLTITDLSVTQHAQSYVYVADKKYYIFNKKQ